MSKEEMIPVPQSVDETKQEITPELIRETLLSTATFLTQAMAAGYEAHFGLQTDVATRTVTVQNLRILREV